MPNPFKRLGQPHLDNPQGEEVSGSFQCQECFETVNTARYLDEAGILTWKCSDGHISNIEGFYID